MSHTPALVRPPALIAGDRVHVVSPAGPVVPEILDRGLSILRGWDLDVVVDDAVYARRPPYDYLAGDDRARLTALNAAWTDRACKAVICSRGGYGAMRLLPHLDGELFRDNPRLLVGFSDITALHLFFAGTVGLATLHGPVIKSLGLHDDDPFESKAHLKAALFGTTDAPAPWTNLICLREGRATGPVFGGNLSLLIALLASPYCPNLEGAIVILEDVGEVDYRLDRLLTALRLGVSDRLGGLVLGDFSDCQGVYVTEEKMEHFLHKLGAEFSCPVVAGAPVGHSDRNVAFPMGVEATLDAGAGELTFSSHAVSS